MFSTIGNEKKNELKKIHEKIFKMTTVYEYLMFQSSNYLKCIDKVWTV